LSNGDIQKFIFRMLISTVGLLVGPYKPSRRLVIAFGQRNIKNGLYNRLDRGAVKKQLLRTVVGDSGQHFIGHVLALNPARLLGSGLAFGCSIQKFWIYLLAELLASVLAAGVAWMYGYLGPNSFLPNPVVRNGIHTPPATQGVQDPAFGSGLREPLISPSISHRLEVAVNVEGAERFVSSLS
jgi:hypothetical protein